MDEIEQQHPRPKKTLRLSLPTLRVLQWILALGVFYTLYFARTLLVPIVIALLLALLLSPSVALFKRFRVPRTISAILLLCAMGVPFTLLGIELAGPAQKWAARIPELSVRVSEQLGALNQAMTAAAMEAKAPEAVMAEPEGFSLRRMFSFEEPQPEVVATEVSENAVTERMLQGGMEFTMWLLGATPILIAQLLTCIILTLFLLISGSKLFDAFINLSPEVKDKERAERLVSIIQQQLSRYILTVSAINVALGLCTAGALYLLDVDDALLWGAMVGLLNFAPYIGPVIGMMILTLAGFAQYGIGLGALLPMFVFFCINLVEAEYVTPMILGRHMRLNPLILMAWLIIWGWLWGAAGVLLAVPLLMCLKLAAAQLGIRPNMVKLIETNG